MRTFRLLSLCSGIGVIDYVWAYVLGQEVAGQIEIDPYCTALLTERFPDVPRRSDIKEVAHENDPTDFGAIDLMAGGIPCQPFSSAGKRRGTQDDRHLWPYAFALIKRYRPPWVLIENVTGFVRLALDLVCTDLESEGYTTQAFVLPACAIGAPHERQRVFIVAYTASGRPQVSAQALRHTCTDQSHPSDPLAHASRARWETAGTWQQAAASLQCSETLADSQGTERQRIGATWSGRPRSANSGETLAHTDGDRQRVGANESQCEHECSSAPDIGTHGAQGDMAHTNPSGLQIGDGCPGQAWAPTTTDGRGAGQSESRLGRGIDGASRWLDQMRWPAPPGEPQYPWEPPRTIAPRRDKDRALRLKALGNAIVPQQIYPILYALLVLMKGLDG